MVVLHSLIFLFIGLTVADVVDVSRLVFPHIDNKQKGATPTEGVHNLAKVVMVKSTVPSAARNIVHCTAHPAIKDLEHIYITASRCLLTLRVQFTVIEKEDGTQMSVKAFVQPITSSKQMYDDISFIVTRKSPSALRFAKTNIRNSENSLKDHASKESGYSVRGFITEYDPATGTMKHKVYRSYGHVGTHLCDDFIQYKVPCFSICTKPDYDGHKCVQYHRGLGHVVYTETSSEPIGIVTWAVNVDYYPIGIALMHTKQYNISLECAEKIYDNTSGDQDYDKLCDTENKNILIRK